MDGHERARDYGSRMAAKMFAGRKGHGGGPCSKRVFTQAELAAVFAVAFDHGYTTAKAVEPDNVVSI